MGVGVERGAYGAVALHIDLCAQAGQTVKEVVDLLLEVVYMSVHLLEFIRLFEVVAAVGRIQALQAEIPAALTRCLPVALYLSSFALVACNGNIAIALRPWLRAAILTLALRIGARVILRAHGVAGIVAVAHDGRGAHSFRPQTMQRGIRSAQGNFALGNSLGGVAVSAASAS